ncbi:acetyl-CoA carboxylase, biotin carboxyl carrier protein [Pseudopedobacter saltans DSM 12145]|uniref:Biotin carboxyl carrier protein of acetyl-CoA carboxylase n=1 Tax=Pseudopedobacter saltans (strain ATCC 51119 / DSM 12145 / JCM 21818 / CCUG 39354 / LMG 10337 / NBRC 100064 / NCIMB 13643) TaxID=762903 RepID=F0SC02_PSESL|nr:acetyl-CoA carboxylase, biotin carboxyl carrier protein [Pseudopedobacter saltans DSM 12145]
MGMDIKQIQDLIKFVAKSGVNEVSIEEEDFKITIKTNQEPTYVAAPAPQVIQASVPATAPVAPVSAPQAPAAAAQPATDNNNYITIKSPMIGTFYRSSSPDKPSFVNVGDEISAGKVLCIVEAMKLFNEIESEVSGRIVKVLVDNAQPVEYDQPLFLVEPI